MKSVLEKHPIQYSKQELEYIRDSLFQQMKVVEDELASRSGEEIAAPGFFMNEYGWFAFKDYRAMYDALREFYPNPTEFESALYQLPTKVYVLKEQLEQNVRP